MKNYFIKIIICLVFLLIPFKGYLVNAHEKQKQVALISVKEGMITQALKNIGERYPNITVRQRYTETYYGFSVSGSLEELSQLASMPLVKDIHFVTTYRAHLEDSIPFIGADEAQLYKDQRGRKITGEGVKVGVIDTGVDYRHPDLKSNYGGGYDTIDLDKDPMETKLEEKSTFHGTHVAGVIAANGKRKGVAPKAKIFAYRALGPGGVGTSETVLAAIERAVKDKVDIINLSLGNDVNGPDWPTSIALDKAVEKGVLAITAAGNSGPGLWTVGSPATASKALTVGASYPPVLFPSIHVKNKETIITPMIGSVKWTKGTDGRFVFKGYGEKSDLKRVKNKIVLLERGKITFTDKVKNAQEAGAKAVIVFNNVNGRFVGQIKGKFSIPAATVSRKEGLWIKKVIEKRKTDAKTGHEKKVDVLAEFSSRGPVTGTWQMKPDLLAPGVQIKSTIPGGYLSLQGTSMASPHVAGAAALLKQLHPDWSTDDLKSVLVNTATPLYKNNKMMYRAYEQGAGRLDIEEALDTETTLYPTSLSFGVTRKVDQQVKKDFVVKVSNKSNKPKQVTAVNNQQTTGIQWVLPKPFSIPAHTSKNVKLSATVEAKDLKDGFYDGAITFSTDDKESLRMPYLLLQGEPNFPSVMGFHFGRVKGKNHYKYELYLPSKVEVYKIAVFESETFRLLGIIDEQKNSKRGIIKKELVLNDFPKNGIYKFVIFYKRKQYESATESYVNVAKVYVED
ncbi:S8 family serine peptidase [Gottfriedia luciferensis]|uniref:S8 family serine peptidase n=1 Tax=Gottfriedia luciferensis TaxID=178774 RepID=UPI000B4397FB